MAQNKKRKSVYKDRDVRCDNGKDNEVKERVDRAKGKKAPRKGKVSKTNDPLWYAANPQILRDTASFSYGRAVGAPIAIAPAEQGATNSYGFDAFMVPGVMSFRTIPSIGSLIRGQTSPIYVAQNRIYSYVRHANSGSANYDPIDLMTYLVAMDSVYSFHAYLKRLYGIINNYQIDNRYLPDTLVSENGVIPSMLRSNLANFRAYVNTFASKMGSLAVPNSMAYFTRHMWMYSGYYIDEHLSKAQIYQYVPQGFYRFTMTSDTPVKWKLEFAKLPPFITLDMLIEYGDSLINPLLINEDINIMSGDILKAFGTNGLMHIDTIGEDYMVLPSVDAEVLTQMRNCDITAVDLDTLDIVADPNGVFTYKPLVTDNETAGWNKLLSVDVADVTPELSMVASRGKVVLPEKLTDTIVACGSDICTSVSVSSGIAVNTLPTAFKNVDWNYDNSFLEVGSSEPLPPIVEHWMQYIAMSSSFAYRPGVWFGTQLTTGGTMTYKALLGTTMNVDNYAILSSHDIERLHETALLSLFSVPTIASVLK